MHRFKKIWRYPIKDYFRSNWRDPLVRILPYIIPYWKIYAALIFFLFLNIFMTFVMAWYLKNVTDAALNQDFLLLRNFFILGAFLLVFGSLMTFANHYVESVARIKVNRDLHVALFDKTLRLRSDQFMKYHSGELLSRLTNDLDSTAGLIGSNLLNLIRLPLTTIAVFLYLASINWKLTLVSLSLAPMIMISGIAFGLLLKKNNTMILDNLAKINSFLNDVFAGHTIVRSFSLERLMLGRYKEYCETQLSLGIKAAKLSGGMNAGAAVASGIAYFLNVGIGAYLVAKGSLTVGSLLAFITLMQYLVYPFIGFASSWSSFQRSVAAFERVWEIIGSESEFTGMPKPQRSNLSSLSIELKNVSFSYDHQTHAVENLNLTIPAGQTTAIVGPSGAGKSTLFKLLLGLHQPTTGNILFNNQPVQKLEHTDFRSFIAYVPQESYLFDGTIRENLLHGYPEATEVEVIRAARDANIHDFIMSLPDQYESKIGERGVRLSGGQKQRMSIARAILKNAPLLLLDEATSALDNENEYAIQESLGKLKNGRTTIVIAHRLSTIQNADWILVMDKGKMVAQGNHHMLLKEDNPYSKMYDLQLRNLSRTSSFNRTSFIL